MNGTVPRIMIAGTGSGCGKTTVTCAVLQALKNRGLDIAPFKCGPDYIDPMFHTRITGTGCSNLDGFFFSENTLNWLLAKNGAGKDLSVIEGVMGFYDGLGIDSTAASSYETARVTGTPVIMTVSARGTALSVLAVIQGFLDFMPDNTVRGVILNQCSEMTWRVLRSAIEERFGGRVRPLGYLPKLPDCSLESRHLGLITADEVSDLMDKAGRLGAQAEQSINLDQLIALAQEAPPIRCEPVQFPRYAEKVRIAVARDKAFCFYYRDSLDALSEMGAEIVPFSPMTDSALPADIHGLWLGGGYPELYAEHLSANGSMLRSVRNAVEGGLPCIAECGGFMYLTRSIGGFPMAGVLPGTCHDTGKLSRFGYIRLRADRESMLFPAGAEIPAHEFHYWDCTDPGDALTAVKSNGKTWNCAFVSDTLYAGFPHFHFYADPRTAVRFYEACLKFRENAHD